jgi:hypothetical protein
MDFKKELVETFNRTYKENTLYAEAELWVEQNGDLFLERWARPNKRELPTVAVKNRSYHYQKCESSRGLKPAYILHGRNGARYGLFRGNESSSLFAVNMKSKKVVKHVGKFRETDNGIEWCSPDAKMMSEEDKE